MCKPVDDGGVAYLTSAYCIVIKSSDSRHVKAKGYQAEEVNMSWLICIFTESKRII